MFSEVSELYLTTYSLEPVPVLVPIPALVLAPPLVPIPSWNRLQYQLIWIVAPTPGIGSRKIGIITALVAALATRRVMISSWGLIGDVYSQYPLQIKKLVSIINSLKLRASIGRPIFVRTKGRYVVSWLGYKL